MTRTLRSPLRLTTFPEVEAEGTERAEFACCVGELAQLSVSVSVGWSRRRSAADREDGVCARASKRLLAQVSRVNTKRPAHSGERLQLCQLRLLALAPFGLVITRGLAGASALSRSEVRYVSREVRIPAGSGTLPTIGCSGEHNLARPRIPRKWGGASSLCAQW